MRTLNLNKIHGAEKQDLSFKQRAATFFINPGRGSSPGVILLLLSVLIPVGLIIYLAPAAALYILPVLIGLPFVYAVIAYPKFGIISLLLFAYIILWINKFDPDYPAGTLLDGLQVL